jgi:uncharacterized repeat protein (TIGR02543 family)
MGNSVRDIGAYAFGSCGNLVNLTIGSGVTNIGNGAFYCCENLTRVRIPDSVRNIGEDAFRECYKLESVTIGNGVTNIGTCAFREIERLTEIVIPASVKSIGDGAFYMCKRLLTATIGNGVTYIGEGSFEECNALKTLYVPASWKTKYLYGAFWTSYAGVPSGCKVVYGLPTWTVTFDANGGTCATKSRKVVKSYAVGSLPKATRTGYTFAGWYTAKSGGSKVSTATKITANRTFYARWTPTTYKIAFDANGGTGTMAAQSVKYGATAKLRANAFKKTGYTFQGWAKTAAGAVAYQNQASVKNLRSDGKTTTLFAKWKATTYKVAFNANGGTGTMAVQTMTYDKAARLAKNAFKRSGFTFIGWAKTKTGAVAYKNATAVKNLRTDGKTTTLYAKWAKNSYKVGFNANGGSGKMTAQAMTYGKAANLKKNAFKRMGYTFAGWAKTKTGAVAYKNAASVKNLRTDGGTQTLFAKWTPTTYKVAFNANGGTGTMTAQSMKYDVTATLRANAFTRKGYTFAGWAKTKTGAVAYKNAESVKNLRIDGGTQTLFAKWTPTTYNVAFDANGGTGTMAAQSMKYDVTATLRANAFTREGYTFGGWSKSKTGGKAYADKQQVKNLRSDGGTVTLYAVWTENPKAETSSGVPYGWLKENAAGILATNGGDYEAAANAKAANGRKVWECYVAGLDPTETKDFTAVLSFDENGKPVIESLDPDLGTKRTYTLQGKKDLMDEDWDNMATVPEDEKDEYRFFCVGVSLPE